MSDDESYLTPNDREFLRKLRDEVAKPKKVYRGWTSKKNLRGIGSWESGRFDSRWLDLLISKSKFDNDDVRVSVTVEVE